MSAFSLANLSDKSLSGSIFSTFSLFISLDTIGLLVVLFLFSSINLRKFLGGEKSFSWFFCTESAELLFKKSSFSIYFDHFKYLYIFYFVYTLLIFESNLGKHLQLCYPFWAQLSYCCNTLNKSQNHNF